MTYYRLLRNNKESGPFPEEEMIANGFKPYDLIWVEGKSAGWRYPSEIPAFKAVAPAIEEQPYDRFYKKQPPQKLFAFEEKSASPQYAPSYSERQTRERAVQQEEPTAPQRIPITGRPSYEQLPVNLPARHIHVTLPSGNTVNLTTLTAGRQTQAPQQSHPAEKPVVNREPVRIAVTTQNADRAFEAAPERAVSQKTVIDQTSGNIPSRNLSFSSASQKTEREAVVTNVGGAAAIYIKSKQTSSSLSWTLLAAAFIGVATLVGLGIMIGLSMNRDKHELAFNEALRLKEQAATQRNTLNANSNKGTVQVPAPEQQAEGNETPAGVGSRTAKELVQNAVVKSTVPAENTLTVKEDKKISTDKAADDQIHRNGTSEPSVVLAKPSTPVNIEKSLALSPNEFKTGAFGGITGLKYTLTNNSRYPLEQVEVEIDYVQANNKVYKTERLLFKDIAAGAQATVEAPSSNRGVKMVSRIIKVNTRETLSNTTAKS